MGKGQQTPLHLRGEIKVPQDVETPLTPLLTPVGTALYLYVRSIDSVNANTVGQDYVTCRYHGKDLVFAVCDGVGQSFMGDLAARLLGDGLVEWLMALNRPASDQSFSTDVTDTLNTLTAKTAQQVTDYSLPGHLPPILKQALEMQRKYGSEAMFVAGRLALDGVDPWIALCWLGDAPIAAVDIDGKLVDLSPRGSTSERWNATTGVKGIVHTWVGDARNVARVAGFTDGMGTDHVPTDADLTRMMEHWVQYPPNDDASLFDVRIAYSPETVGEKESPDETRRILHLPASATEPGYFAPQEDNQPIIVGIPEEEPTRPIVVEDIPVTPIAGVEPIEVPPAATPATGEWRPLTDKPVSTPPKAETTTGSDELLDPYTQQQIQMWQQAAIYGLTSAALAMRMLERLMKEQEEKRKKR